VVASYKLAMDTLGLAIAATLAATSNPLTAISPPSTKQRIFFHPGSLEPPTGINSVSGRGSVVSELYLNGWTS
jgi:hypothetical protein